MLKYIKGRNLTEEQLYLHSYREAIINAGVRLLGDVAILGSPILLSIDPYPHSCKSPLALDCSKVISLAETLGEWGRPRWLRPRENCVQLSM